MMKHAIVILFLLLNSLFLAPSSHASFDYAMKLYQEGKYDEAKYVFESLALVGDSLSLFNLGVLYHQGLGVEKNAAYAHALMRVANDDFSTEGFVNKIAQVESQLTDTEKEDAEQFYLELKGTYSSSAAVEKIFPKPKADKDSSPELEKLNIKGNRLVYPEKNLRKGYWGTAHIEFIVSPEGYAREVKVESETNNDFGRATREWVERINYKPPEDGLPVYSVRQITTFRFGDEVSKRVLNKVKDKLEILHSEAATDDPLAQYKYAAGLYSLRSFKDDLKGIDLEFQDINDWYLKSATAGFSPAQYEIGMNMRKGRGCEQDTQGGLKWIIASAMGGYTKAQVDLGTILLRRGSSSYEYFGGIEWLKRAVSSGDDYAKVHLAWEQATSGNEVFRDAEQALALISSDLETYHDEVRVLETKAAAYAEKGDFERAIWTQKQAKKKAKRKGWKIAKLDERLALYTSGQAYRGSYY